MTDYEQQRQNQPYPNQYYGGYQNFGQNANQAGKQMLYYDQSDQSELQEHGKGLIGTETRNKFISKVYSILSFQLGITVAICFAAIQSADFNEFLKDRDHVWIYYFALVISLIVCFTLACFRSTARTVPANYILLSVFTIAESYIVAQICVFTNPRIVIMAGLLTIVMFLALTLYALTTKTDFTMAGGLLFVCCCVMCVAGLFLCFTNNNVAHIIYSCLGVILFSIYIIYDTQLLLDNKQFSYSIDDYIIAALQLYLDIINLFINILSILGRSSD